MKTQKGVYSIQELTEIGYPVNLIKQLMRSEDFPELGFRTGKSRNSKAYFHKDKLDSYLKKMTEVNR